MIFDPGDVCTCSFPYVEKRGFVVRPVVVIGGDAGFTAASGIVLVAMITTAGQSAWPLDVAIQDIKAAGLRHPCLVRMKVISPALDLIDRHIGRLNDPDWVEVCGSLRKLFPYL